MAEGRNTGATVFYNLLSGLQQRGNSDILILCLWIMEHEQWTDKESQDK